MAPDDHHPDIDPSRTILHIDMDAYFASVEILGRPELREKPVIVSGNPLLRTVVSSCNYIAKRRGVSSGMPLTRALRLIPDAVIVEGSSGKYTTYTRRILRILLGFTPFVEPVSIDEVFLELHDSRMRDNPSRVSAALQQLILEKTGLWASIGIGRNKLLAKMASRRAKPRGICRLEPDDISDFPVDSIWGVGPETTATLQKFGMRTVGDLRGLGLTQLRMMLGAHGEVLFFLCRGVDHTPLIPYDETEPPKSISHEYTFPGDVVTSEEYLPVLANMAQKVGRRARDEGYRGCSITLKYRLPDLKGRSRTRGISRPTDQDQLILRIARELADEALGFPIRLIGVSLGKLVPSSYGQQELFEERSRKVNRLSDQVREKYGEKSIMSARCLIAYERKRKRARGTKADGKGPFPPALQPSYLLSRDRKKAGELDRSA